MKQAISQATTANEVHTVVTDLFVYMRCSSSLTVVCVSQSLESRINVLKKKKAKKVKKGPPADGGGGGDDADSTARLQVVIKDNVRLRDREEVLLEAVSTLLHTCVLYDQTSVTA